MGPCLYCRKMIYHEGIAERGWHRQCREEYDAKRTSDAQRAERDAKEHEKRRRRKAAKRQEMKAQGLSYAQELEGLEAE